MYQRFGMEEYVLKNGGVLCPQPGCGAGILVEPDCTRITCAGGCGVSVYLLFCNLQQQFFCLSLFRNRKLSNGLALLKIASISLLFSNVSDLKIQGNVGENDQSVKKNTYS